MRFRGGKGREAPAGEPRETFTPGEGAIRVEFVSGNDGLGPIPLVVARAGLERRFAVLQHSDVEGCWDWWFDEPLWRALISFAGDYGDELTVLPRFRDELEMPLDQFLAVIDRTARENREPVWGLLVRSGGVLTLGMVTDYWCQVGGPNPYQDSYAYSLYSNRDLGDEVRAHLAGEVEASRWQLADHVVSIPQNKIRAPQAIPGRFSRWLSRLTGARRRKA